MEDKKWNFILGCYVDGDEKSSVADRYDAEDIESWIALFKQHYWKQALRRELGTLGKEPYPLRTRDSNWRYVDGNEKSSVADRYDAEEMDS